MPIIEKFFGTSPFAMLLEHTQKVHECVELLTPLTDALLAGDYDKIEELHNEMSRREHQADEIKNDVRAKLSKAYLMSVRRDDLMLFLAYQDDVADAAEDFAVVLLLRKTKMPEELHEDFRLFVGQIIKVSEHLLNLAQELSVLAESAFTGKEADKFISDIEGIGKEEWEADRLQRRFARHFYDIEDQIDPVSIFFFDKYSISLSAIANSAEKTAKYLRQIIGKG
jgi:predicted phosphate transport protein (TIGR00153 family)